MKGGFEGIITAVKDSDSNLLKYLDKISARPGLKIKVLNKEEYDESLEVLLDNKKVFLSKEVSRNILVSG